MAPSAQDSSLQVRVGVAAVIVGADGRLILGRRKGSLGAGQYGFPGGHIDFGESYYQCAERETLEETGLRVKATRVLALANSVFNSERQYVTIFVHCKHDGSEEKPQLMEPEKCYGWEYLSWNDIKRMVAQQPDDFFLPIVNLLREYPNPEELVRD